MRSNFGLTTGQWLVKLQLDHAQRMLSDSRDSIARIAMSSGDSNQSAFTRQLRRATGLSPREYRKARRGEQATVTYAPAKHPTRLPARFGESDRSVLELGRR